MTEHCVEIIKVPGGIGEATRINVAIHLQRFSWLSHAGSRTNRGLWQSEGSHIEMIKAQCHPHLKLLVCVCVCGQAYIDVAQACHAGTTAPSMYCNRHSDSDKSQHQSISLFLAGGCTRTSLLATPQGVAAVGSGPVSTCRLQ